VPHGLQKHFFFPLQRHGFQKHCFFFWLSASPFHFIALRHVHTQPNTENARGVEDIQWRGAGLTHALYVLNVLLL
jgi:hypothetical protein